ncbi:glycosyltransferase family 2 protein [Campylobacter sp. FMV-PI01]|uniref:Glycosyltransferase family 2 protein n=1 Tax=Campylobacter portucalensis TaxID=2608384 RepID=A0A6L5WJU1_9BACT|nr:glycosyltransferase family 2 protein [Campylobacter portucalensis]MSN96712.1 glycosyltransferase family 2 protein [Campylobacter portucalensis]
MDKICFLVPYYNHPQKIKILVDRLKSYQIHIILIDDGSSDKDVLEALGIDILTHSQNEGKGRALKTGFEYALKNGFTHAFQIDADMQHDLNKIDKFLEIYKNDKKSIICGYGKYDKTAPKSRIYGRKITNFWGYINTLGGHFEDFMIGMRIYPINNKVILKTKSNRMEFDIEILINYYKMGYKFKWIEVDINYDSISHFKMLRDNFLISKMHARCFFSLPKFIYKKIKNELV